MSRSQLARLAAPQVATAALALSIPAFVEDAESRLAAAFGFDTTNACSCRAILQEREGIQLQSWTELTYKLFSA